MFIVNIILGMLKTQSQKIKYVLSKLNGDKPSNITLEELKNQHYDSKYYPRYFKIVSGSDYDRDTVRSEMVKEINLTPENQVIFFFVLFFFLQYKI